MLIHYHNSSILYGAGCAVERTTLLEVNRMLNHLLNIGCHAGDLDASLQSLDDIIEYNIIQRLLGPKKGSKNGSHYYW